uniref:Uncharacterized protein n=1 Tax=Meloidogyne floridensis TaxID=298350 RepID=A0A915NGF4_9BILA
MELENKNYDEYQKQIYGLALIYEIKVKVIKYIINERFKTPFYKSPTFPRHNIEQSPHGIIKGNYQINNRMPLFDNQVSTPALANYQHTENVGTSTSNQLKSVNYPIRDQTTTMNKSIDTFN